MDLVALFGKRLSKLRSDYSATPKGRVTDYSDFFLIHGKFIRFQGTSPGVIEYKVVKTMNLFFRITGLRNLSPVMDFTKIENRLVNYILYARTDIRLDKFVIPVGKHPV